MALALWDDDMADRTDYYFRERVTEAELNLGFDLLEQADRNLAADLNIYGVVTGAVPAAHVPVADLTVDLTAPATAYDALGERIFFGTGQNVDCSVDLTGIPTDVPTAGSERWVGIFLRFKRLLSDPRTDGNSQQVYFRRDESFELVVRQAPVGPAGAAPKAALQPEELLVCDVLRRAGQTQIIATDIDTSRRQAFVFARSTSVAVTTTGWSVLAPLSATVQAALDDIDMELRQHFAATGRRHAATAIDFAPHGFVASTTVQAALNELVDGLSSPADGASGASRVGASGVPGSPSPLPPGNLATQLAALLGLINAHVGAASDAHKASAIEATPFGYLRSANVQAQLQEIVSDLLGTTAAAPGAVLIGMDAVAGVPNSLAAEPVRFAIANLLSFINAHVVQAVGAHAATAISVADPEGNLNAIEVEGSLAEVLDAYKGDHFRGNDPTPGQHRTIRQPSLGGSKALLWDSMGVGSLSAHLRVYADGDSIWFTVNAAWNGVAWGRDRVGTISGGFSFARYAFSVFQESSVAPTFTAWTSIWRLPLNGPTNSAFELSGSIQEVGRLGIEFTNGDPAASHNLPAGVSVTLRNRFPASPSSITTTPITMSTGFVGSVVIGFADRDGFACSAYQNLGPGATAWWFGTYTAVA